MCFNKWWFYTHQFLALSKGQDAKLASSESQTARQIHKVTGWIRSWTQDEHYRHGWFTLFKYGIQTEKQGKRNLLETG
jgi:hypothetical protein